MWLGPVVNVFVGNDFNSCKNGLGDQDAVGRGWLSGLCEPCIRLQSKIIQQESVIYERGIPLRITQTENVKLMQISSGMVREVGPHLIVVHLFMFLGFRWTQQQWFKTLWHTGVLEWCRSRATWWLRAQAATAVLQPYLQRATSASIVQHLCAYPVAATWLQRAGRSRGNAEGCCHDVSRLRQSLEY